MINRTILLVVLSIIMMASAVNAATVISDNFNEYQFFSGTPLYNEMRSKSWIIDDITSPPDDDVWLTDSNGPIDSYYTAVMNQSAIIVNLNTTGYVNVQLSYDRRTRAGYIFSMNVLEVSWRIGDSGEWNNLETVGTFSLTSEGDTTPWESKAYDLAGAENNPLVQVRFQNYGWSFPIPSNNGNKSNSQIDNVIITGDPDLCPEDPLKTEPGICGCGVADTDTDGDGTPDCNDNCDDDPLKTEPGICGCGVEDTDTDSDGTPDCIDECPEDPNKVEPGECGCGVEDTDTDGDGTPDCNDNCPTIFNPDQTDSNQNGIGDACDETVCDGIDNDQDDEIDEDYVVTDTTCGTGICSDNTGQLTCVGGLEVDTCDPFAGAALDDTLCDGLDNDCNGETDEDYILDESCFLPGVCSSENVASSCSAGVEIACATGTPAADDTLCDNLDNDCNGETDEDYVATPTSCGLGVCAATGELQCLAGTPTDTCSAGSATGADDDCNGIDEDCSGVEDDNYIPDEFCFLPGVCAAGNTASTCVAGVETACATGTATGADDDCNGIDEDCSGVEDDNYVPLPTECGLGVCYATGTTSCVGGSAEDSCVTGAPTGADDDCNNADEDCDGTADEHYIFTLTSCGIGACASTGTLECISGAEVDSCEEGTPAADDVTCDNIDDDCDATADEDYASASTECGLGACASTGATSCVDGSVQDSCTAGDPSGISEAICNGNDDDCDATTDEDYAQDGSCFLPGVCEAGNTASTCIGGVETLCLAGTPSGIPENVCNDLDDDCDGAIDEEDSDLDGTPDCNDLCPEDFFKTAPGICGCGVADTDTDSDGTADCFDECPTDADKIAPGTCGCGTPETDSDGDDTPDCIDECPADPAKTAAGECGCGVADTDTDGDGTADCNDLCPNDPLKTEPEVCGCGVADTDTDGDGTPDCNDLCPNDAGKIDPGICGCGVADTDSDGDGTADCLDECPNDPDKIAPGTCGCGVADTDTDGDGTADCNDLCPNDPDKIAPGTCGCGVEDTDTDGDGIMDCNDNCIIGFNPGQEDSDGDGTGDACDGTGPVIVVTLTPLSPAVDDDVRICAEITTETPPIVPPVTLGWELYNPSDPDNAVASDSSEIFDDGVGADEVAGDGIYCSLLFSDILNPEDGWYVNYLITATDASTTSQQEGRYYYDGANPLADANGPYYCLEEETIILDGSGSSDSVDTELDYAWDIDDDGFFDDLSSSAPDYICSGEGVHIVKLQVTDNVGNTAEDETTAYVATIVPTADAGGPYACTEGTAITLEGTGSHDPNLGDLNYAWDLDNDGEFDDAFIANPVYGCGEGPGNVPVALEISDLAASDVDNSVITINNNAPVVGNLEVNEPVKEGSETTLIFEFTDYQEDSQSAVINWGDGSADTTIDPADSPVQATHIYTDGNSDHTITATVTDDDLDPGSNTLDITVENVAPTAYQDSSYNTELNTEFCGFNGWAIDPAGMFGEYDTMTYYWDFSYNGITFNTEAFGEELIKPCWTYEMRGHYIVALQVCDEDGGCSEIVTATLGFWDWRIDLHEGWNLISIPLVPLNESGAVDTSIQNVLINPLGESLADDVTYPILSLQFNDSVKENIWLQNTRTGIGNDSTLTDVVPGYAYWIKIDQATQLLGKGQKLNARGMPPRVKLQPLEWNLIGKYGNTSVRKSSQLGDLGYNTAELKNLADFPLVEVNDEDLSPGSYLGPLDLMLPREGYWTFMGGHQSNEPIIYIPSAADYALVGGP